MTLYSPSEDDYINSLNYAKNLKCSNNNKIVFHCLWKVPQDFGRKQFATLKSIIINHKDIIDTVEINLWSNVDLSENIFLKEIKKFITLRKWDLHEEIKNTILEDFELLSDNS